MLFAEIPESIQYIAATAIFLLVKDFIDGRRADRVAKELKKDNVVQSDKLDSIHTLVNSNMGTQLKIAAVAIRRVATMTNHADDMAAADLAEKLLAEHMHKQAVVDAKPLDAVVRP